MQLVRWPTAVSMALIEWQVIHCLNAWFLPKPVQIILITAINKGTTHSHLMIGMPQELSILKKKSLSHTFGKKPDFLCGILLALCEATNA